MKLKNFLIETVQTHAYSDTQLAQDDDYPTGNIIMGDKYEKVNYYNKLTSFDVNWQPEIGKWIWNQFDACGGMGSKQSYSDTLENNDDYGIQNDRMFYHMTSKKPQSIPKDLRALGNDVLPGSDAWGNKERAAETDQNKPEPEKEVEQKNKPDLNNLLKRIETYIDNKRG